MFQRVCLAGLLASVAYAQPPGMLPPSLSGAPRPMLSTKPRDPEQERKTAIKNLREDIVAFDPSTLNVKKVEGHWAVISNTGVLKDFGVDRGSAEETARLLRDLKVNEIGTIPGARPTLEYWLTDGKAPKPTLDRRIMMPIMSRSIHAENIGGAWVITDGARAFYDFGTNEEAAKQGAIVFWKYGFNQLGVIGAPNPQVLYPLCDPNQLAREQQLPKFVSSPLSLASDVTKSSLLLPGNVYGGPRIPVDLKNVEIVKRDFEYYLAHGKDTWGRFGTTEYQARAVLKLLQDAKVDEVVKLGDSEWPLFLAQGQVLNVRPLGVPVTKVRLDRLKLQKLRESWWLFEDTRPVLECTSKHDAEVMLLAMQQYGLDTISLFGRPDGGLRLLSKGR